MAQDWNQGRSQKNKAAYTVLTPKFTGIWKASRRGLGYGCLSGVAAGDKLYVLAHGAAQGSTTIGANRGAVLTPGAGPFGGAYWQGGTLKSYTAVQLARALDDEGLTHAFVDLRIFACGSAVRPTHTPLATPPYAHALRNALQALGYANIQVTGYNNTVYAQYQTHGTDDERHKGIETELRGVSGRAKVGRQTF